MKNKKIKKNKKTNEKNKEANIVPLAKGVIGAYIITFSVFIIYGVLLTYTAMTEKNIQLIVMLTTVISTFVAGLICSFNMKNKGLLYGSLSGLLYAVIMIMISFCVLPKVTIGSKAIITAILAVSAGGIGGIIGVNIKK